MEYVGPPECADRKHVYRDSIMDNHNNQGRYATTWLSTKVSNAERRIYSRLRDENRSNMSLPDPFVPNRARRDQRPLLKCCPVVVSGSKNPSFSYAGILPFLTPRPKQSREQHPETMATNEGRGFLNPTQSWVVLQHHRGAPAVPIPAAPVRRGADQEDEPERVGRCVPSNWSPGPPGSTLSRYGFTLKRARRRRRPIDRVVVFRFNPDLTSSAALTVRPC